MELTKNEQKILKFIETFHEKKGYVPSYSDIQEKFGFKAKSSVQQYIEQLTTKGYLLERADKARRLPIQLVQTNVAAAPDLQKVASRAEEFLVSIPLEGKVAAGRLTEAVQHREYIDIPRDLLKPQADYFALRVKGDSMIGDCIMDGDTVVIRRQHSAQNGQTVVALVGDEATIKRYYKKRDKVELHPANPTYDVIEVGSQVEFRILGILSSVIRKLE
jgi:repressor LexA